MEPQELDEAIVAGESFTGRRRPDEDLRSEAIDPLGRQAEARRIIERPRLDGLEELPSTEPLHRPRAERAHGIVEEDMVPRPLSREDAQGFPAPAFAASISFTRASIRGKLLGLKPDSLATTLPDASSQTVVGSERTW